MADSPSSPAPASAASPVLAIVYWLVAGVPLAWGVYQTVQKSIPLFHVTSAATATATPAPAGADPTIVAPIPAAAATPAALPSPDTAPTPATGMAPAPDASPFSTAQPAATVAPINPPASPGS